MLISKISPQKIMKFKVEKYIFYAEARDWWRFIQPFEPKTRKFLEEHIRGASLFIDIGAHIGIYAIPASHYTNVIAFEPEPTNFFLLYKNVMANNAHNKVVPLPLAISDTYGIDELCISDTSSGHHTLNKEHNCHKKITIIKTTLDQILIHFNSKPDIIKIDIEGHEDRAFHGMKKTLEHKPVLIVETTDKSHIYKYLTSIGYKAIKLDCWNETLCNYGFTPLF
jgi:FkbM family methyltransferase